MISGFSYLQTHLAHGETLCLLELYLTRHAQSYSLTELPMGKVVFVNLPRRFVQTTNAVKGSLIFSSRKIYRVR